MLSSNLLKSSATKVSINGIPLYGRVPVNGLVPAISDISGNGWNFNNTLGNYLILGTTAANSNKLTTGVPGGTATVTSSYSGDHSSIGPLGSQQTWNYSSIYTSSGWNGIGGGHTHSATFTWPGGGSGYIPSSKSLGFFSGDNLDTLPPNSIVFANTQPDGDFTLYTGHNNHRLATASTIGQISSNIGSSSFSLSPVTSSSGGNHYHANGTKYKTSQTNWYSPPPSGYFDQDPPAQTGAHIHSVYGNFNYTSNDVVYLKPWISNSYNYITSGCIILWNNTKSILPTGWVFCDGSTIRGVTTPNLNRSKIFMISSTQNNGYYVSGSNILTLTSTFDSVNVIHSHLGRTVYQYYGSISGIYHSYGNWTHSHTGSTNYSVSPATRSMSFIMYIP